MKAVVFEKPEKTKTPKSFKRSIEDHIKYYRDKKIEEKLAETIEISDFCMKFAESARRAKFNGK